MWSGRCMMQHPGAYVHDAGIRVAYNPCMHPPCWRHACRLLLACVAADCMSKRQQHSASSHCTPDAHGDVQIHPHALHSLAWKCTITLALRHVHARLPLGTSLHVFHQELEHAHIHTHTHMYSHMCPRMYTHMYTHARTRAHTCTAAASNPEAMTPSRIQTPAPQLPVQSVAPATRALFVSCPAPAYCTPSHLYHMNKTLPFTTLIDL